MTTYTWPTGDTAFIPRAITFTHANAQLMNVSPLNGTTQSYGLPGDRLKVRLDFPRHSYAERARLEAFFRRLDGMRNRVSLWDLARSVPQGNWTPSGVTVSGAVAQFAGSLTLASCLGRNLHLYPQNFDNAYWSKGGLVGVPTADTVVAPDGTTTAEKLVPSTSVASHTLSRSLNGFVSGELVTLSIHAQAVSIGCIALQLAATGAFAGVANDVRRNLVTGLPLTGEAGTPVSRGAIALSGGWYRLWITALTVASGAINSIAYISNDSNFSSAGNGTDGVALWGMQLERGVLTDYARNASAQAGDWLQVPTSTGNQLAMVMADATANDAGAMTVEIRPMLRGAVSSGAAIVLDKPSSLFVLPDRELAIPRGGSGICPEFSIDLYEVFA